MGEEMEVRRTWLFDKISDLGVCTSLSTSWRKEERKRQGKGKKRRSMKRKREAGMGRGENSVSSDWASCKSLELCRIRVLDSPNP